MRRLLLDSGGYLQRTLLDDADGHWASRIEAARARLAAAGCPTPAIETTARYRWARQVLDGVVTQPSRYKTTATDRIDRVLTHRLWGTLVFAVVMLVVFQSVFVWARPAMEWIQAITLAAGGWVSAHMAEGAFRSLLVNGVIGGTGAVFAFLPQILILFAFLAVLEDCGYMARMAYLMDRLMVRVGLSGKSFIPLLSSFACAVPGVMATRVIENERDRLTTMLVAPLLTCSARLPVYALLIAAIIPAQSYWGGLLNLQGLTLAGLYLLGIVAAVVVALLLKRTILRGQTPPFVMELPSYKWPSPRTVFFRVADRGWVFLRCAGTLILAVSILVWAALYFPHDPQVNAPAATAEQLSRPGRPGDRAGGEAARMGLADRLRGACFAARSGDRRGHARRHVPRRRRTRERRGRRQLAIVEETSQCHVGRRRSAGVYDSHGAFDHGIFCAMRPVRGHFGGDSPRDEQLALAGVYVRVHDGVGVRRCAGDVSSGNVDRRLVDSRISNIRKE